jgi:hypothetical protein
MIVGVAASIPPILLCSIALPRVPSFSLSKSRDLSFEVLLASSTFLLVFNDNLAVPRFPIFCTCLSDRLHARSHSTVVRDEMTLDD